jgi:hypothetical protein
LHDALVAARRRPDAAGAAAVPDPRGDSMSDDDRERSPIYRYLQALHAR